MSVLQNVCNRKLISFALQLCHRSEIHQVSGITLHLWQPRVCNVNWCKVITEINYITCARVLCIICGMPEVYIETRLAKVNHPL